MQDRTLKDKDVADVIIEKLKCTNVVVPFAEIARSAKEEGRKDLAALVSPFLQCMYMYVCLIPSLQRCIYMYVSKTS